MTISLAGTASWVEEAQAYESGGGRPPPVLKNSGQTLLSGQTQAAQKSWMIKNAYSIPLIQGKLCFHGQAQVAQKSWIMKNISIKWKISGQTLFFRANGSSSKILNDKKYFNTVKNSRATLFLRISASCSKILNDKKYIQYSGKFHGKLCFSGQGEKIFYTVYSASKGNYHSVSCQGEPNTQGP